MKMKKEQGVTCEELRNLEVGYDHDFFNHVTLRMLTAFVQQGYVSKTFNHYFITNR